MGNGFYGNVDINTDFYESGGNNIDLRNELSKILDRYGQWIVIRKMSSEKSKYFDNYYKESSVGPTFQYTDWIVKARFTYYGMHTGRGDERYILPANLITPQPIFYIPHTNPITENDIIYTLVDSKSFGEKPINVNPLTDYETKYDISLVVKMRGDKGRIEYYVVYTKGME